MMMISKGGQMEENVSWVICCQTYKMYVQSFYLNQRTCHKLVPREK